MDKPEHVYPAVLLMLSVDADKSGVLVTQDIDTGSPQWLSVAVNEGVGGAVDVSEVPIQLMRFRPQRTNRFGREVGHVAGRALVHVRHEIGERVVPE